MTKYPLLSEKIENISEGDVEFRAQLTAAIYQGLLDLKNGYQKGKELKDGLIIHQIRHKVRPTLILFGFDDIIPLLEEGKKIINSDGFGSLFELHAETLKKSLDIALDEINKLK